MSPCCVQTHPHCPARSRRRDPPHTAARPGGGGQARWHGGGGIPMGVPDAPEDGDVVKAPGAVLMLFQTPQNFPRAPRPGQPPTGSVRFSDAVGGLLRTEGAGRG